MKPKDYISKKAAEEALKAYQGSQLNSTQETSPYFVGKINSDRTKITDPTGRQYKLIFTGNPKEYELAQRLSDDTAVVNATAHKSINVDGGRPYQSLFALSMSLPVSGQDPAFHFVKFYLFDAKTGRLYRIPLDRFPGSIMGQNIETARVGSFLVRPFMRFSEDGKSVVCSVNYRQEPAGNIPSGGFKGTCNPAFLELVNIRLTDEPDTSDPYFDDVYKLEYEDLNSNSVFITGPPRIIGLESSYGDFGGDCWGFDYSYGRIEIIQRVFAQPNFPQNLENYDMWSFVDLRSGVRTNAPVYFQVINGNTDNGGINIFGTRSALDPSNVVRKYEDPSFAFLGISGQSNYPQYTGDTDLRYWARFYGANFTPPDFPETYQDVIDYIFLDGNSYNSSYFYRNIAIADADLPIGSSDAADIIHNENPERMVVTEGRKIYRAFLFSGDNIPENKRLSPMDLSYFGQMKSISPNTVKCLKQTVSLETNTSIGLGTVTGGPFTPYILKLTDTNKSKLLPSEIRPVEEMNFTFIKSLYPLNYSSVFELVREKDRFGLPQFIGAAIQDFYM